MPITIINDARMRFGWCIGRVPPRPLSGTFVVKGTFALQPGKPASLLPEGDQENLTGDIHTGDDENKSLRYSSDLAWFKPYADLFLAGACHPPGATPTTACRVTFGVGSWSKTLAVIGDRLGTSGLFSSSMTEPVPFRTMPLTWENALGGPGFEKNPFGKGIHEDAMPDGRRALRLPNIEDPRNLMQSPRSRPEPAGFGPLPPNGPERRSKIGSYGQNWLKIHWPWFPDDFDWTYFNAAPSDQQLRTYLRGDEKVFFENLHPEHANYEARLPGLRVRWFQMEREAGALRFREVPLNLDTLWVDTDSEKLILVWRGVAEVRSKKMAEIEEHFLVSEPLSEAPKPVSYYGARLPRRKAEIADEAVVKPALIKPAPPIKVATPDMSWSKKLDEDIAKIEARFAKLDAQEKAYAKGLKEYFQSLGMTAPMLDAPPPPPDAKGFAAALATQHAELAKNSPKFAAEHGPPPSMDDFVKMEQIAKEPMGEPRPPSGLPEARRTWTRETVIFHAASKGEFLEEDLTALDLSGLDLKGVRFRGSILTRCNLRKARLNGADLSQAVLKGAILTGASLDEAILSEADFAETELSSASFVRAKLDGASFSKAKMAGANFSASVGKGPDFTASVLEGAIFDGARLPRAGFTGAKLANASFKSAHLTDACYDQAQGPGVDMSGSDLTKLRAGEGAQFPKGRFLKCRAPGSIWEGASLDGAEFSETDLTFASFLGSSLKGTTLFRCKMRKARLAEANLEGAKVVKVDLFRASLEGAKLVGADFTGSNLYEAEFYEADLAGADFNQANLKGTKLA